MAWKGEQGERKATEARELFLQREDRERERGRVQHIRLCKKSTPPKVAGEKERERVKTLTEE